MGNDQIFKRRRMADSKSLARREPSRSPNKRILIVTEGTETERSYFNPLVQRFGMPTIDVVIRDDCDSAPSSL